LEIFAEPGEQFRDALNSERALDQIVSVLERFILPCEHCQATDTQNCDTCGAVSFADGITSVKIVLGLLAGATLRNEGACKFAANLAASLAEVRPEYIEIGSLSVIFELLEKAQWPDVRRSLLEDFWFNFPMIIEWRDPAKREFLDNVGVIIQQNFALKRFGDKILSII